MKSILIMTVVTVFLVNLCDAQNVGISVATPQEKLDVNGSALLSGGNRILKFETSPATSTNIKYAPGVSFVRTNGTEIGRVEYVDTFGHINYMRVRMGDPIVNAITLNENNLIGINSIDPQARLHIRGGTGYDELSIMSGNPLETATIQFYFSPINGSIGNKMAFIQSDATDFRLGTNSGNQNGKTIFRMAGTDRVFIDSTGNIQVLGLQDASLTTHGYLMLGSYTGSNIIMDNNEIVARNPNGAIGNLILQNDGGTVRVGSVAVPTGFRFAVDGKMICEELKVQMSGSWPDYVFSKNYKLRTLPELGRYIQDNKHLPGIPSAAEIEKNGLVVGDMQKRMMEKIEELTLYILDLQQQIDVLRKK